MKIVYLYLTCLSLAVVYDFEKTDLIFIKPASGTQITAKSNPVSGYIWYLISSNSPKLTIESPSGVYTEPESNSSNFGTLTFTLKCSDACEDGEVFEIIGALQHTWDPDPLETKRIAVQVSKDLDD